MFLRHPVLSIQSHVVHGYVGNKAAVFPLQLLGHNVDVINTVQFTSMFIHEGERLSRESLATLLKTLPQATTQTRLEPCLSPVQQRYLLTGYIGSASLLYCILDFYTQQLPVRGTAGKLTLVPEVPFRWICDPVLGDNGKLYVSPELVSVYRQSVLPVAHIITPNHYELEWLCEKSVKTLDDALGCCAQLHDKGTPIVIVTSLKGVTENPNNLLLLGSCNVEGSSITRFTIEFPCLDIYLGGTGDLFCAMLLHGLDRFNQDIRKATSFAVNVVQVLVVTVSTELLSDQRFNFALKIAQTHILVLARVTYCQ